MYLFLKGYKMSVLIKNNRQSNFELLRIFSMFLIVLHHCNTHGVFSYWHNNVSILHHINNFIVFLFSSGGKVGVTLFVLLTGYFSCTQNFSLKKWIYIYLKTAFFAVFMCLIYFFIDSEQAKVSLVYSIFPFTHNAYWFITSYLLLQIFSPLLNIILKTISPKLIQRYVIIGGTLWILFPLFSFNLGYSILLYFMYLYILGGALRLNYINFSHKYFSILFWVFFIYFLSVELMLIWNIGPEINLWLLFSHVELNLPYTFFVSLALFCLFKNIKVQSAWINWIAGSMLGVYLLHDSNLVRTHLWHTILAVDTSMQSPYFMVTYYFYQYLWGVYSVG